MRLMFHGCPAGPDVRTIQNRLNLASIKGGEQMSKLPLLVADGVFGAKTAKRVVEFQAVNGLTVDGVVGRKTENCLNDLLGSPTFLTPEHVPPAQKKALAKAFENSESGKAGAKVPASSRKSGPKMGI